MKRLLWLSIPFALWLHCRHGERCRLAEYWHAPAPHYDYIQAIELRPNGTGEMIMGEGQHVVTDVRVRYRVARDSITFDYVAGSDAKPRTVDFRLDAGDFVIVEPGYDEPRKRRFRCRLHFAENPFPPDTYSDDHFDYYGCEQ